MLSLLLIKILPARASRIVQQVAEAIVEAQELRKAMHRKYRLGFDS